MKKLIPSGRQIRSEAAFSDSRGRPLSYSAETDNKIAHWVKSHTEKGLPVTNSELRKHAKGIVIKENANFTASASWAQNFLLRHKLSLQPNTPLDPQKSSNIPAQGQGQQTAGILVEGATTSSTTMPLQITSISSVAKTGSFQLQDASASLPGRSTVVASSSATPLPPAPLFTGGGASATDDPVTSTLALLTGEAGDPNQLTQSQAAALASLTELTGDAASLVDLLNSAQEAAAADASMAFTQTPLDSSAGQSIYLSDLMVPTSSITAEGQQQPSLGSLSHPLLPHSVDTEVIHTCSRPLSYTKETDVALANWVKEQQAAGHKVTFASLRSYAKKLVSAENPHFNASVGWVTPFLLRHNLDLKINDKRRPTRKPTTPRKLQAKGEELLVQEGGATSSDEPRVDSDVTTEILDSSATGGLTIAPGVTETILSTEQLSQAAVNTPVSLTGNPAVATSATGIPQLQESGPLAMEEFLPPVKRIKMGMRTRHTLAEKLEVVRLMKQYNLAGHYVCRMLGIANSTIAGWVKLVEQKGAELEALSANRKRSNRSGQGRPLSYSRDKDEAIARWVCQQQEMGVQVTAADLTNYATSVIGAENANFVASVGWRHKFLQRHGLQLSKADKSAPQEDQHSIPIAVQTEEVCTDEFNPDALDKLYPDDLDLQLVEWVQAKVAENGSLSVQVLCRRAEEVIIPVNPVFVGTLGWALKFLYRHNLFLDPKPVNADLPRKRSSFGDGSESITPKKQTPTAALGVQAESVTVSPSTGNLCEALLALSNPQDGELLHPKEAGLEDRVQSTYFGKPAREFTSEEKEEVVRYANATTLQKAAIKYGVAAPTVWRWRMELKLHQPKYTPMQKKYIIKCAETNSLKDAAQRFGITTKTVQNWRRALQTDGTLSDDQVSIPPGSLEGQSEAEIAASTAAVAAAAAAAASGLIAEEVIPMDNSPFQYIVDGGEVTEASRVQEQDAATSAAGVLTTPTSTPLEVTHEIQVQDVGMEYDVISSEGHAAKPRCTPQEKLHILQYALDHSIKEASQRFGISPGTLYYWKKNFLSSKGRPQAAAAPTEPVSSSSSLGGVAGTVSDGSFPQMTRTGLETTVVSVPMPPDVSMIATNSSGLIQPSSAAVEALQALASSMEASVLPQQLTDPLSGQGSAASTDLIQAITQTLASATPEQLHSLQQITSDLNLLQAVTSLVTAQDGSGQVRQAAGELSQRHDSTGGAISSPTDVLVSFQPSDHTEEVQTSSSQDISVPADAGHPQVVELASSSVNQEVLEPEGVPDVQGLIQVPSSSSMPPQSTDTVE